MTATTQSAEKVTASDLENFFGEVTRYFWVPGGRTLRDLEFSAVPPGSICEAILLAHGVNAGSGGEKLTKDIEKLRVFPRQEFWESGLIVASKAPARSIDLDDMFVANRYTTPRKVNDFLVSNYVVELLRQLFPEQMEAMAAEELRRQESQ